MTEDPAFSARSSSSTVSSDLLRVRVKDPNSRDGRAALVTLTGMSSAKGGYKSIAIDAICGASTWERHYLSSWKNGSYLA